MFVKKDKIMVRIAGFAGIIFAAVYWVANHFHLTELQLIIAKFFYFWSGLLALVLIMYLLLIRALLRHMHIMSKSYDPHEGKNPQEQGKDFTSEYWSTIFEGIIISLIIATTIAGISISGVKYFIEIIFT